MPSTFIIYYHQRQRPSRFLFAPTSIGSPSGIFVSSTSVQPLSMKYQRISIELRAIEVAGTAPKVQGVAA